MAKNSGTGPTGPRKGGGGGRSRPPKRWDSPPKTGTGKGSTHKGPGGGAVGGDCCPMVAALRSVKRGKFRLAWRYAAMSVRLILA